MKKPTLKDKAYKVAKRQKISIYCMIDFMKGYKLGYLQSTKDKKMYLKTWQRMKKNGATK